MPARSASVNWGAVAVRIGATLPDTSEPHTVQKWAPSMASVPHLAQVTGELLMARAQLTTLPLLLLHRESCLLLATGYSLWRGRPIADAVHAHWKHRSTSDFAAPAVHGVAARVDAHTGTQRPSLAALTSPLDAR